MGSFWSCISRVTLGALAAGLMVTSASALLNPISPVASKAGGGPDCGNTDIPRASEINGYLVRPASNSLQRRQWQPRGGEIPFTIHVPDGFATDSTVRVCVRWHTPGGKQKFMEASARIDSISTTRDPTIVATIPDLPASPPRWQWSASLLGDATADADLGSYAALALVPLADVRIMVIDKSGTVKADIVGAIGVTAGWWALLLAVGSVVLVFFLLCHLCLKRTPELADVNPILRVITTAKGYASLSQFQIVLWTFVVGTSVIYVMALSGELIKITTGTLVLLGISGTAVLTSQVQSNKEEARAKTPGAAPTPTAANTAASAAAAKPDETKPDAAAAPAAPKHVASWCDLIVDQGQIDVTRLQMLYFTIVVAVFVLMTVVASYEIPEIPESFLVLMGISNGVYVAAKFNR